MTAVASRDPQAETDSVIAQFDNVKVDFPAAGGSIFQRHRSVATAVDGVSLQINRGETLGLVGESGSGKTTLGRTLVRLTKPTAGVVRYERRDITELGKQAQAATRREIQMIFQDPYASLNPRMTVGQAIAEPIRIHGLRQNPADIAERVGELLEMVGLAAKFRSRYPQEFSGGQRQRIGIARALAIEPKFIVCDEPVSALDVSVQAQVVNLLEDLQDELGLTYLFIAHSLGVVRHISDRVAVMYRGKIVELASRDDLYERPHHPYTAALLSAMPIPEPRIERERQRILLKGDVLDSPTAPTGCAFHPRCPVAIDRCRVEAPELISHGDGHISACHRASEVPVLLPVEGLRTKLGG